MGKLIERNHSIDAFRVVAIFGVVAIHIKSGTENAALIGNFFSHFSVPFFYSVSLLYFIIGLKKSREEIGVENLIKIFHRLVLPYLIWTIIYVCLRLIKVQLVGGQSDIVLWRAFFYGESAVQLYFIPYLLSMQMTILSLSLLLKENLASKAKGALLLILVILYLSFGILNNCFGISIGFSLIGMPLYILVAYSSTFFMSKEFNSKTIIIGLAIILITGFLINKDIFFRTLDYPLVCPFLAFGILLLGIGLYDRIRLPLIISSATYGIYLGHVLILEAFELTVSKLKLNIDYTFFEKLIITSLVFAISLYLVVLLRKFKLLRVYLLGEK